MTFSLGKKWEEILNSTYSILPNGYRISPEDRGQIDPNGKGAVYGEMIPEGMNIILDGLNLSEEDTFIDLGSGVGKVVIQVALSRPALKVKGIELSKERFSSSISAKDFIKKFMLHEEKKLWEDKVEFIHGDILKEQMRDVTCAFMCSTCFSDNVIDQCAYRLLESPKLRLIATLSRFSDECEEKFDIVKHVMIPTSWSNSSKVFFYKPR